MLQARINIDIGNANALMVLGGLVEGGERERGRGRGKERKESDLYSGFFSEEKEILVQ